MEVNSKNCKLCDICKSQATYICLECICNYYCESCYKLIHDLKINSSHKKEKLDLFIPLETRCSIHNNNSLDLFCVDEKGN